LTAGGVTDNLFGSRVAVAEDTVLVAGTGVVYVFERTPGTDIWQEGTPLTPGGPTADFGRAFAFDGQTAIVGARGLAYLFRRTGPAQWKEIAVLTPDEGESDDFGRSVDIYAEQAIVGAPGATSAAYIFRRSDGQPERWEATALLTGDIGFGDGVAIRGDMAAVIDSNLNTTYFFLRDANGQWQLLRQQRFFYAQSVALSESTAVVGGTEILIF
jgi:outer membrane protein assembly factor BamB